MSTTLRKRRLVAITLMALLAALATIAATANSQANAAGVNGFKSAKFRIEVKGWQKTVQQHTHEAEDRCDVSDYSSGTERLTFRTVKPIVITAAKIPGLDNPEFFGGRRLGIPTQAIINRSFTPRRDTSLPEDCGDNGGGAEETPQDCGRRVRNPWKLELGYIEKHRNLLGLSYSGGLTDPYANCPGAGYPATFPFIAENRGLYGRGAPIAAQLSQAELFDRNFRKWISIANGVYKQRNADWWATTTLHWEVSFTRLRGR
jgi:hypothetical protein